MRAWCNINWLEKHVYVFFNARHGQTAVSTDGQLFTTAIETGLVRTFCAFRFSHRSLSLARLSSPFLFVYVVHYVRRTESRPLLLRSFRPVKNSSCLLFLLKRAALVDPGVSSMTTDIGQCCKSDEREKGWTNEAFSHFQNNNSDYNIVRRTVVFSQCKEEARVYNVVCYDFHRFDFDGHFRLDCRTTTTTTDCGGVDDGLGVLRCCWPKRCPLRPL